MTKIFEITLDAQEFIEARLTDQIMDALTDIAIEIINHVF